VRTLGAIGLAFAVATVLGSAATHAASKEEEQLRDAATVVEEILDIPDAIPQELLNKAEGIVVLPSVKKSPSASAGATARAPCYAAEETISRSPGARPPCTGSRAATSAFSSEARPPISSCSS
jgi:hypothetical protein